MYSKNLDAPDTWGRHKGMPRNYPFHPYFAEYALLVPAIGAMVVLGIAGITLNYLTPNPSRAKPSPLEKILPK